jgi:hypothetical protein
MPDKEKARPPEEPAKRSAPGVVIDFFRAHPGLSRRKRPSPKPRRKLLQPIITRSGRNFAALFKIFLSHLSSSSPLTPSLSSFSVHYPPLLCSCLYNHSFRHSFPLVTSFAPCCLRIELRREFSSLGKQCTWLRILIMVLPTQPMVGLVNIRQQYSP